ncbi:MAG TPA: ArsR family transcriptional regulator [Bryobacteraceae bacterium]|nr:ArsR family transcriptional regulator [Bryobacteraceae bacterium]
MDAAVSAIAFAIAEPARTRMLFSLLDRRARTSTELAVVAGVSPSTASVHLARLRSARLVRLETQGKHRYYRLAGAQVAAALERLSLLAGAARPKYIPNTPHRLRAARSCYDHLAGTLGVALHDRLRAMGWLARSHRAYDLTPQGVAAVERLGIDVATLKRLRRRFAFPCLDWSERRAHLGGALGAAFLNLALEKKWVIQDLDSRALSVTRSGTREMQARFGLHLTTFDKMIRK